MPIHSHEVDYEIIGSSMQLGEVELDPQETVIAEAGAMAYMEDGIGFEARMGDGSEVDDGFFGKLMGAGKRIITGESLFMTHFTNVGQGKKRVAFAAPYPGTILAIDLAEIGGQLTAQKDSFLAAAMGTRIGIRFSKRIGTGLFGGEGHGNRMNIPVIQGFRAPYLSSFHPSRTASSFAECHLSYWFPASIS